MKVKEVMSMNPACCTPSDTAQNVAKMMCDLNVARFQLFLITSRAY